jgi:hypothetical protein
VFLPTLLLFLMALTLAIMIWLGSQAFSRGVYACRMALPDLGTTSTSLRSPSSLRSSDAFTDSRPAQHEGRFPEVNRERTPEERLACESRKSPAVDFVVCASAAIATISSLFAVLPPSIHPK